ncbi:MAG TPA: hypothetical protein VI230_00390 [Ignavibacteriaceae bacterium]
MKLLFFLLPMSYSLLAQQNEVNQKLEMLFNTLDAEYVIYEQNNYELNLSKDKLDKLIKQIYELYSYHGVDLQAFIDRRVRINEKEYKESGGKTSLNKPVLSMVRKIINNAMGENFFEIITTPYYFKLQILKIDHNTKYKSRTNEYYPKTTMMCEILQVFKGEHLFRSGEQIELNYLNYWNVGKYEEGKIYFMPVRLWDCDDNNGCDYSPNLFPIYFDRVSFDGGPFGVYPIENNQIKNAEYFQIADSNWNTFKTIFKEKYILQVGK